MKFRPPIDIHESTVDRHYARDQTGPPVADPIIARISGTVKNAREGSEALASLANVASDEKSLGAQNLSHVVKNAIVGKTYTVTISAISISGAASSFTNSTSLTPTARTTVTAPTSVTYIASGIGAPLAYELEWAASPDADYLWTEVFENLDTGVSVTPGSSTLASYTVVGTTTIHYYPASIITGFNLQVWVRHVTRSGAKSSWVYAGEHTPDKLDGDVIAPNAITNTHLASNSVDTGQLVGSSVTGSKIAAANVVTSHLADSAVTSAKIADGAVDTPEIADAAVTLAKISNTATVVSDGTAGLSVGAKGTYATLKNNSGSLINAGTNTAGANLSYSDSTALSSGSSPAGTWQCMGRCSNGGSAEWLRVS